MGESWGTPIRTPRAEPTVSTRARSSTRLTRSTRREGTRMRYTNPSPRRRSHSRRRSLRNAMNSLAEYSGKSEAKTAAKKFYQDMEMVNLLSKRKKQDAALDAYAQMM